MLNPKESHKGDLRVIVVVRIEEHLDVTRGCTGAQAIANEERDGVSDFERKGLNPVAIRTVGLYSLLLE